MAKNNLGHQKGRNHDAQNLDALEKVLRGELIGSEIAILDSGNKKLVGLKGRIIDETKNIIVISTADGEKRIIKKEVKIRFTRSDITVDGELLAKRPEERIKTKIGKNRNG